MTDPDATLAAMLEAPLDDEDDGELLTLPELADRAGLSASLLEALEREGLLVPRDTSGEQPRYAASDAGMISDGMALLESGLPLGELLQLARHADSTLRELADHAVEVFTQFVRDPIRGEADSPEEAAEELVGAFRSMLPATTTLVAHHFRRLVVARARERLTAAAEDGVGVEDPDDGARGSR